jgi:DNA polymerase III subunit gamma/tau
MADQTQSLYRKWRSQTFTDLVGQDTVTQTLRQAVLQHRLAHAYLFCGPRGTGKTSSARLLAKLVNCSNLQNGEPCNQCLTCLEITEGRSTDVFEIDAASNRGIDEIRDLRDRVRIMSGSGRTRLYIIDEVHMLTNEAFNALLKTLEEPPPRVIFILATTEAHKVPATVLSRCQRFDFRRISVQNIISHLGYVSQQENMQVEPAALELLARAAQGGMRDALSLLDQAHAFCGDHISGEQVRGMLGMTDPVLVNELIDFVATGNAGAGLERINDLIQSGMDPRQLTSQLSEVWRHLMLARAGANLEAILEVPAETSAALRAQSERFTLEHLAACARIFARNDVGGRAQVVPQLALELALLDCIHAIHNSTQQVVQPVKSTQLETAKIVITEPHPAPKQQSNIITTPAEPLPAPQVKRPSEIPPTPISTPRNPPPVATPPSSNIEQVAKTATPVPPVTPPNAGEISELLAQAVSQWNVICKLCKMKNTQVEALLKEAHPAHIDASDPPVLILIVNGAFHLSKLSDPKRRVIVEASVSECLNRPFKVHFISPDDAAQMKLSIVTASPSSTPATNTPPHAADAPANIVNMGAAMDSSPSLLVPEVDPLSPTTAAIPDPKDDPLVQQLMERYGAQLTGIIHRHDG